MLEGMKESFADPKDKGSRESEVTPLTINK